VWKRTLAGARHGQLALILVLAFFLRVSGNLYDMPYGFHPDEYQYFDDAVEMMRKGTSSPASFRNPPLFNYVILLALHALFGAKYAMGNVTGVVEFLSSLPVTLAFRIARGLSALAGTATCLVLYLLGRRYGGGLAGLLAAGLYAVAFLSVRDAHFAVNDIPMVSLLTLAVLFAVRLLEEGQPRDLVLGGLTAGLAAATKYNGGIALLPLLLACLLGAPRRGGRASAGRAGAVALKWLALLLLALAGFLLGNPYALLDPPAFLAGLGTQYGLRGQMWRGQSAASVPLLVLQGLVVELGWPLLLCFPLAAAICLLRGGARAKATGLALSVVVPLVLYHSAQALFFARFLLPCTPFIALIGAWGLVALREGTRRPWARQPLVLGAGLALLIASPLARSVYLDRLLQRPDTRILAKTYLDRVAPAGSAIVLEGSRYYPTYTPPLDPLRYRLLDLASDPSLLLPTSTSADYYLFSSFITGRVPGILEAEERSLMAGLEGLGFARILFSPLHDGGDPPFENDQVYLPYRGLFRYDRPGPAIVIYARPGMPLPPLSGGPGGAPGLNRFVAPARPAPGSTAANTPGHRIA